MPGKNILYAQSGGPTAVINASACGVIETARKQMPDAKIFAGKNGIIGVLNDELIDTAFESDEEIALLKHTPASAFEFHASRNRQTTTHSQTKYRSSMPVVPLCLISKNTVLKIHHSSMPVVPLCLISKNTVLKIHHISKGIF